MFMTEHVGRVLGSKAGFVKEVDIPKNKIFWSKWLRVRVHVNVSSPMKQGC